MTDTTEANTLALISPPMPTLAEPAVPISASSSAMTSLTREVREGIGSENKTGIIKRARREGGNVFGEVLKLLLRATNVSDINPNHWSMIERFMEKNIKEGYKFGGKSKKYLTHYLALSGRIPFRGAMYGGAGRRGTATPHGGSPTLELPEPMHAIADLDADEAVKEEAEAINADKDEKYQEALTQQMAKREIQIDNEKMRIFLRQVGIVYTSEQDRIIRQVQMKYAGLPVGTEGSLAEREMNREAIELLKLPKTALNTETNLPLLGELTDHAIIPKTGAVLAGNLVDQSRLSKPIILKKPSKLSHGIERIQKVMKTGTLDNQNTGKS